MCQNEFANCVQGFDTHWWMNSVTHISRKTMAYYTVSQPNSHNITFNKFGSILTNDKTVQTLLAIKRTFICDYIEKRSLLSYTM